MNAPDRGDRTLRLVQHAIEHAGLVVEPPHPSSWRKEPTVTASLPMYPPPTFVTSTGDFAEWLRGEAAEYLGFVPTLLEIKAVCDVLAYRARRRLHEAASAAPEGS